MNTSDQEFVSMKQQMTIHVFLKFTCNSKTKVEEVINKQEEVTQERALRGMNGRQV